MKTTAIVAFACVLAGCASYRPMVMPSSVGNPLVYEQDLAQCQGYARQVSPGAAAAGGAILGGLFGAVLGAAVGNHEVAEHVMRVYAVQGAAVGAAGAANTQVDIIRRCMSAHGYLVLN